MIAICHDVVCVPSAVFIRMAAAGDARPLAALMTELGYPTAEDDMATRLRRILARSDHLVAVAVREGEVVGAVAATIGLHLEINGRHGRVTALIVTAGHRGRGIGELLLAHAESWLRDHGADVCIINCSTHRKDAHRFYQREGYRPTGIRFRKDLRC